MTHAKGWVFSIAVLAVSIPYLGCSGSGVKEFTPFWSQEYERSLSAKLFSEESEDLRYFVIPGAQLGEVCIGLRFDHRLRKYVLERRAASASIYYLVRPPAEGQASAKSPSVDTLTVAKKSITIQRSTAKSIKDLWLAIVGQPSQFTSDDSTVVFDGPIEILAIKSPRFGWLRFQLIDGSDSITRFSDIVTGLDEACRLGGVRGKKVLARVEKECRSLMLSVQRKH